jgi:membrane peptidoglycan carboxypeptidase
MPSVPEVIAMRRERKTRFRKSPAPRAALSGSLLFSLLLVAAALLIPLVYSNLTRDLPPPEALAALLEPPDGLLRQPTRLYDRSGEVVLYTLENPAASEAEYLEYGGLLPTSLISATVATADPDFWSHAGFSLDGLKPTSHPTLAQRLAADLLLWEEPPSLRRALRERLLAAQITSAYGREQVLEWYLNSADFGSLAYGADAAARAYFGKPASQITLAEAAVLAAAAEVPEQNPLDDPQAAIQRQQQVIQTMLVHKLLSVDEAVAARRQSLIFAKRASTAAGPNAAYISLALSQVYQRIPAERFQRGGFTIITTLDAGLQDQVTCALQEQVRRMQDSSASPTQALECDAARLLPTLLRHEPQRLPGLEASAIVMDPLTSEILALGVVSPRPDRQAVLAPHPAGTILSPFIYLTGFTRGLTPATLVWDLPAPAGETALPNLDNKYHGPLRARLALANDFWNPTQAALESAGLENTRRIARQMGLSLAGAAATGTAGVESLLEENASLLELGRAYSILASGGLLTGQPAEGGGGIQAAVLLSIEDVHGRSWYASAAPAVQPVIASQLAYLVTNVLSDEPARWLTLGHPNPLEVGRPAAAKLGRTLGGEDAWTFGYTPQRVVGVWLGLTNLPAGVELQTAAAGAWHAILQYASRDLPPENWPRPAGIASQAVCDPSGGLPTENCPSIVQEIFLSGTEPTHLDSLYRTVLVNRETGRLATIFTPPDLTEERVYLFPPPEAAEWAVSAGYETAPEAYDAVVLPTTAPGVQITYPAMFAYVRGEVNILGSAAGEDFAFYRVQVGRGLNPQQWLQIGQDITRPAVNSKLAVWDTRGLSGLYVIELRTVRSDQRVERSFLLVTVDNQAPEVSVRYPAQGESITPHPRGTVTIQVEVEDDTVVDTVELFIDGERLAILHSAPFAYPWRPTAGEHTLRAAARDRAGNETVATIQFTVEK